MIDMTNAEINNIRVISRAQNNKYGDAMWNCVCYCGKEFVARGYALRGRHTRSCGCLQRESARRNSTIHGAHGSRIYSIWYGMIQRCTNPNNTAYQDYGAKGITVCSEWRKAKAFIDWALSNGYQDGLTIDRIDNARGYRPDNCRFLTRCEQNRNTTRNRYVNKEGVLITTAQAAELVGVTRATAAKWHRELGLRDFREYVEKEIGINNPRHVRAK